MPPQCPTSIYNVMVAFKMQIQVPVYTGKIHTGLRTFCKNGINKLKACNLSSQKRRWVTTQTVAHEGDTAIKGRSLTDMEIAADLPLTLSKFFIDLGKEINVLLCHIMWRSTDYLHHIHEAFWVSGLHSNPRLGKTQLGFCMCLCYSPGLPTNVVWSFRCSWILELNGTNDPFKMRVYRSLENVQILK